MSTQERSLVERTSGGVGEAEESDCGVLRGSATCGTCGRRPHVQTSHGGIEGELYDGVCWRLDGSSTSRNHLSEGVARVARPLAKPEAAAQSAHLC